MIFKKKDKGPSSETLQEKRIAIDIGLSSIKFAYFKESLLCLDEFPLSDQPKDIKAMKQKDLSDSQASTIKKAVSMMSPNAEFILSPQPSFQVLTRVLPRPLETDIRRFLDKELPFEPDQFGFDINRLDPVSKEKKSKKSPKKSPKIALAAADVEFIQRSIGLLGEHQLRVKQFTPDPVALINYLIMISNGEADEPVVLLDLGALYSHLVIFKRRDQFLARTIEIGGNHFNRELVQKLNVDFETAEKIKKERKLIDDSLFDSKGSSSSMPMFQAINSILFRLIDEVKHSMTYFEDCFFEDLSKAGILLSGGSSGLQNIDKFLEKELELPVRNADSAVYDLTPDNQFAPQFTSVIGLLGTHARKDLFNINLMKNIEGMLFKLEDGDYYLTKEGFVNKKKYKKTQKSKPLTPKVGRKPSIEFEETEPSPIAFLMTLPARIKALIKGNKFEMSGTRFSFSFMEMTSMKAHIKTIVIVLGALFLVVYGGNQFFWAKTKNRLDQSINGYLSKSQEVDRARGALMAEMRGAEVGAAGLMIKVTRSDKIILANKLKAIAEAIPERVWVSDLSVRGSPPSLFISCHVYSYGEDHLKDIALFIQTLKSNDNFLKDFKDIIFKSALRSKKDKDVYDFTLTFPLKRNMIEEKKETLMSAKG